MLLLPQIVIDGSLNVEPDFFNCLRSIDIMYKIQLAVVFKYRCCFLTVAVKSLLQGLAVIIFSLIEFTAAYITDTFLLWSKSQ